MVSENSPTAASDAQGQLAIVASMTESTDALIAFLRERINEDEMIAQLVASDSPTDDTSSCMWATAFTVDPDRLIVAVDYQRVLADVTAKRRIIDAYLEVRDQDSPTYASADDYMETVVRELASAYADHEDYRDEWAD